LTGLLLDTSAFYWWRTGDELLTAAARAAIANPATETFVSAVSAWEIVTKWRSGKEPGLAAMAVGFAGVIKAQGFMELALTVRHAELSANLPMHHKDPFDRMLIAQALLENCGIVTGDLIFDRYGVNRLW
jgi:PIN domain nuclease of toxin-antitoxin system